MSSPTIECQKSSADRKKVGLEFVECSIHWGGKWMKRRLASALPRCYIPIETCMECNVCIIYFEVSTHSS